MTLTYAKLQEILAHREAGRKGLQTVAKANKAMEFCLSELKAIKRAKELIAETEAGILHAALHLDCAPYWRDYPDEDRRTVELLVMIFRKRGFSTRYVDLIHPVLTPEGHELFPGKQVNRFHTLVSLA